MMHRFGGKWTEEKLERLHKYLMAYRRIFTGNPRAAYFSTYYVDAFAGSGSREIGKSSDGSRAPLFGDGGDGDVLEYKRGSARIALEIESPFDHYLFIDADPEHISELEMFKSEYRLLADRIEIKNAEANDYMKHWCEEMNWGRNRAVMFLDPYGMQVEWDTIEAVASTKAVDMWLLFPLGQAVNRLLTKDEPPPDAWAARLTKMLGTDEWRNDFYRRIENRDLFDEADDKFLKTATYESIGSFFIERLRSVFAGVADRPLALYNSKNIPIYLLCFAAGNPKGAPTAVKIADDLLQG